MNRVLLMCWFATAAFPQADRLTFDVTSIRPAAQGERPQFAVEPGGRLTATAWAVKPMIQVAYDIPGFWVSGGPNWIQFDRWDISATAQDSDANDAAAEAGGKYHDRMLQRVQSLLADRFQLKVHRETKDLAGFELTVGKGGAKLSEAAPDPSKTPGIRTRGGVKDSLGRLIGGGTLTGEQATMEMLASTLTRNVSMPVVDKTGLTARYDFTLEYGLDPGAPGAAGAANEGAEAPPPLVVAIQKLGLRLEPAKVPTQVLIIDRIEKPSEN